MSNLTRTAVVDKNGKSTHVYRALDKIDKAKKRTAHIEANKNTPGNLSFEDWMTLQNKDKKFRKFTSSLSPLLRRRRQGRTIASENATNALDSLTHHYQSNTTPDAEYIANSKSILAQYPESEFKPFTEFTINELRGYLDWYGTGYNQALHISKPSGETTFSRVAAIDRALHDIADGSEDPRSLWMLTQAHPFFKSLAESDFVKLSMGELTEIAKKHNESFLSNHEIAKAIETDTEYSRNRSPLLNSFASDTWGNYAVWSLERDMDKLGSKTPRADAISWMAWLYNELEEDSGKWYHTYKRRDKREKYFYKNNRKDGENYTIDYQSFQYELASKIPFGVFKKFEEAGIKDTALIYDAYRGGLRKPDSMMDYIRLGIEDYGYIKQAMKNGVDAELAKSMLDA